MTRSLCLVASKEAGGVAVLVVAAMFGMMALCAAFLSSALTEHAAEASATEAEHALRFAEAGTAYAIHEIDRNQDFETDGIGEATFAIEGGRATVTIDPGFGGAGIYTMHAIGTHNRTRRAIDTIMSVKGRRFSSGFFAKDSIAFTGNYSIDSYDSSLGTYSSQVGASGWAGSDGDVATNGNITTNSNIIIHGDARPGPTGSFIGNPGVVTGTIAPLEEARALDSFTYSPPIPTNGNIADTKTLTAGTYRFGTITLAGGKTLTINGHVELYVDSTFSVSGSSQVTLNPGATVNLYHGSGDFIATGNGIVNKSGKPPALQIFSATTGKVEVSGTASFHGAVYAPKATFVSMGGATLFGAVVSKTIEVSGGGKLHSDKALEGLGGHKVKMIMSRSAIP